MKKNIIAKELESWNEFEYSLIREDNILFTRMLMYAERSRRIIH
jgi:hypothetical protein